jgi:hypothetical protein
VWNSEATATGALGFKGKILAVKGEAKGMDHLRARSKQNNTSSEGGARHTLDQVVAGEYAGAPHSHAPTPSSAREQAFQSHGIGSIPRRFSFSS